MCGSACGCVLEEGEGKNWKDMGESEGRHGKGNGGKAKGMEGK